MPDGRRLIFVVGPSGAGKDSVIGGARLALADRPDVVFPRRTITRPADDSGGEDHEPCEPSAFQRRVEAGDFALHWSANGLSYGVPAAIDRDLAAGRAVVVNVSRTIIAAAEACYPDLCVCVVNACAAVRATRLQQRGRESGEDIARRLERAGRFVVTARRVREIDNDGPLAVSVAALVETILACLGNQAAVASAASA